MRKEDQGLFKLKVLIVHCQRALLFYQTKVVPNEKDVLMQNKDSKQNKVQFAVSTSVIPVFFSFLKVKFLNL